MRVIFVILIIVALGAAAWGAYSFINEPFSCYLTQPATYHGRYIGNWELTINAGQSVTLPDGNTAACTDNGLSVR